MTGIEEDFADSICEEIDRIFTELRAGRLSLSSGQRVAIEQTKGILSDLVAASEGDRRDRVVAAAGKLDEILDATAPRPSAVDIPPLQALRKVPAPDPAGSPVATAAAATAATPPTDARLAPPADARLAPPADAPPADAPMADPLPADPPPAGARLAPDAGPGPDQEPARSPRLDPTALRLAAAAASAETARAKAEAMAGPRHEATDDVSEAGAGGPKREKRKADRKPAVAKPPSAGRRVERKVAKAEKAAQDSAARVEAETARAKAAAEKVERARAAKLDAQAAKWRSKEDKEEARRNKLAARSGHRRLGKVVSSVLIAGLAATAGGFAYEWHQGTQSINQWKQLAEAQTSTNGSQFTAQQHFLTELKAAGADSVAPQSDLSTVDQEVLAIQGQLETPSSGSQVSHLKSLAAVAGTVANGLQECLSGATAIENQINASGTGSAAARDLAGSEAAAANVCLQATQADQQFQATLTKLGYK